LSLSTVYSGNEKGRLGLVFVKDIQEVTGELIRTIIVCHGERVWYFASHNDFAIGYSSDVWALDPLGRFALGDFIGVTSAIAKLTVRRHAVGGRHATVTCEASMSVM
jgi:hypothetical protein